MKMKNITNIKDLSGITGFLNGQSGLHEYENEFLGKLIEENKQYLILDNLFEDNSKLKKIIKCNNLILSTTGMYHEKLKPLISMFDKMNYIPKVVIFFGENSALYFSGHARELKKKGTQFFYPNFLHLEELNEIEWL